MDVTASQITGVPIVYSTVCSGANQRKHQSSASLAFVRGIHRWPVNSPHKGPVKQKMFPFDDVIKVQNNTLTALGSMKFPATRIRSGQAALVPSEWMDTGVYIEMHSNNKEVTFNNCSTNMAVWYHLDYFSIMNCSILARSMSEA